MLLTININTANVSIMEKLKTYLETNNITQKQFAKMLGIESQGAISQWFTKNKIPAERVLQIEKATENKVTRHDLRPDLYPLDETA